MIRHSSPMTNSRRPSATACSACPPPPRNRSTPPMPPRSPPGACKAARPTHARASTGLFPRPRRRKICASSTRRDDQLRTIGTARSGAPGRSTTPGPGAAGRTQGPLPMSARGTAAQAGPQRDVRHTCRSTAMRRPAARNDGGPDGGIRGGRRGPGPRRRPGRRRDLRRVRPDSAWTTSERLFRAWTATSSASSTWAGRATSSRPRVSADAPRRRRRHQATSRPPDLSATTPTGRPLDRLLVEEAGQERLRGVDQAAAGRGTNTTW